MTEQITRNQAFSEGVALICAATACFAVLDTTAKYTTTVLAVPLLQAIWIRFVIHGIISAALVGPKALRAASRTTKPGHQMLRGVFMLGATAFNFAALQYLQLDQGATIFFLSPFFVAALAGPMLGEWIGWRRLLTICIGFSGVLLVIRPGFGGIHWAVSFSFIATLSYSLYSLWTRYLARYDTSETTQVWSPLAGIILLAPFALMEWQTPQSAWTWALLISLGLSGGLGHWLLILAHARAPAPMIAPFGYVNIIFMIALEIAVFSNLPSWWTLAGAAIIIASGLYLLFRERQVQASSAPASSATVPGG